MSPVLCPSARASRFAISLGRRPSRTLTTAFRPGEPGPCKRCIDCLMRSRLARQTSQPPRLGAHWRCPAWLRRPRATRGGVVADAIPGCVAANVRAGVSGV
eukprot:2296955-Prymnesium_polylepis.3